MLRVIQSAEAVADITDIAEYLAGDSWTSAERFIAAVERAYQMLAEMPGIGTLRDFDNPELIGLRMWPISEFKNYLIFYRFTEEALDIVRVIHGRRDLDRIFRQGIP